MTRIRPNGPVLVVSAFAPELAPLRRALDRRALSESAVVCVPVGIGLVDAAIGATDAIRAFGPRLALFLGTGGSYGTRHPAGTVVIARAIALASTAVARGDGYLPAPMFRRTETDPFARRALLRASEREASLGDVANTLAITCGAPTARRLAKMFAVTVENLEAFAVARAARLAGVPFAAVLGISNHVGPQAHAEWRRHQAAATRAATAVVERFLVAELKAPSRSDARPRSPRRRRPG